MIVATTPGNFLDAAINGIGGLIGDLGANFALIVGPTRQIGTLIPDVTVKEVHSDELAITDHPVERGAAISDHAFKRPSEVEMTVGYSNSTGGSEDYARNAYAEFISLQAEREPFTVYTGKRMYKDMLISSLRTSTDEKSEHILLLVVSLRQINITNTQSAPASEGNSKSGGSLGNGSESGTKSPQATGPEISSFAQSSGIQYNQQPSFGTLEGPRNFGNYPLNLSSGGTGNLTGS